MESGGAYVPAGPRRPSNPRRDRDLAFLRRLQAGEGLNEVERLRHQRPPDALLEGARQFNDGRFFDAHETLERVWRKSWYPERLFHQGLIKVAVGQEHLKRGNSAGAMSQSLDGQSLLQPFAPTVFTIDVALLLSGLKDFIRALRDGDTGAPPLRIAVGE